MENKRILRQKRHRRIRSRVRGTGNIPRIAVYRSNKRLQVQLIDDEKGETLFSLLGVGKSKIQAETLGKQFASKMNSLKLTKAVFDRGGFLYHGSIQVFADTLRANGVTF